MSDRARRDEQTVARTVPISPEWFDHRHAAPVRLSLDSCTGEPLGRFRITARAADHPDIAALGIDEDDRRIAGGRFEERCGCFAAEQLWKFRRVDDPADDGFVGIGGRHYVLAGTNIGQQLARLFRVGEIPVGAQLAEGLERRVEMPLGDRTRTAACDETAEREVAEARFVAFAQKIEERRTCAIVVELR